MGQSIKNRYTPIEAEKERCEKIRKIYLEEIDHLLAREKELSDLIPAPVQPGHVVKFRRQHALKLLLEDAPNLFLLHHETKNLQKCADWLHRERKRVSQAELGMSAGGKLIAEHWPVDWAGESDLGRTMERVLDRKLILANREIQISNLRNIDDYHELEGETRTDLQSVRDQKLMDDTERARQAHYNPPQKDKTHSKERTGAYRTIRLFYNLIRNGIFCSWNDMLRRAKSIQRDFCISPGCCEKEISKTITREMGAQIDPYEYVRRANDVHKRLLDTLPNPAADEYLEPLLSRKRQSNKGRVDFISGKYYAEFIKVPLLNLAKRRMP